MQLLPVGKTDLVLPAPVKFCDIIQPRIFTNQHTFHNPLYISIAASTREHAWLRSCFASYFKIVVPLFAKATSRRRIETTSSPPKAVFATVTPQKKKPARPTSFNSFCILEVRVVANNLYS